jgi:Protein of unknown function (DUF2789).
VGASLLAIDCAAVTQSFAMKKEPDMESPTHSLPNLFKQLGLPDDAESIDKFIADPFTAQTRIAPGGCVLLDQEPGGFPA